MNFKEMLRGFASHVDRLMHEAEPGSQKPMAPERSMARPKAQHPGEPMTPALAHPWAVAPARQEDRSPSRLSRLRDRLRHPDTLREAMILKEIFDRPLARRRR